MRLNPLRAVFFRSNAWLSCRAAVLVANSRSGLDYHRARGFRAPRELVIANGIDTDRFRPDPQLGAALRAALGIAPQARVIGRVGRLDPVKGFPTFLDAAARLVEASAGKHGELVYLCVGGGPEAVRRALEAHGAALGLAQRVIWTGERDDMPAVYNACDVAVSSSLGEGFPNVVAEAMACGVPCVATDVGASGELIGGLGRLVPPADPDALAAALEALLEAAPPSARCRARIVERYSVASLVEATERALEQAIRSHPRSAPAARTSS